MPNAITDTSRPDTSRPDTSRPDTRRPGTSPRATSSGGRVHHVLVRLQHEWDRLDRSGRALEQARAWHLPVAPFASLDELLRRCGYGASGRGRHDDDEVLAELVRLARADELAARVVLQRMLPAISSLSRSEPSYVLRQEALHELLTASWTVIRTYPIEQRPTYVAANLTRSIRYVAFREPHRRPVRHECRPWWVFDLSPAAEDDPVTPARELDELLRDAAAAGVDREGLELARRLASGVAPAELAAEHHVTERTIRNRRAAVVTRLREVALA